jgi:hypothetical protein
MGALARFSVLVIALFWFACQPSAVSSSPSASSRAELATAANASVRPAPRTPQPIVAAAPVPLLLKSEQVGDVPFTHLRLLVTSDGRAIWWTNDESKLVQRRLSALGVDTLIKLATDTGLFTQSRDLGRTLLPGKTPGPGHGGGASIVTLSNATSVVRVSALFHFPDDDAFRSDPGRDDLLALADKLNDLSWLPATAWADPAAGPYLAGYYRLFIALRSGVQDPLVVVPIGSLWPFTSPPESFGNLMPQAVPDPRVTPIRCAVLTASDARLVGEALMRAGPGRYDGDERSFVAELTWPAGNGYVTFAIEPVLPQEQPTCAAPSSPL